jgi:hypothetical protein
MKMSSSNIHTVRPDSKGRIALGKLAQDISSFHVTQEADGRIVLEPFAEIPAREKWLYENEEAMQKVLKGLKDSSEGKISSRGDFSQYMEDEIE